MTTITTTPTTTKSSTLMHQLALHLAAAPAEQAGPQVESGPRCSPAPTRAGTAHQAVGHPVAR